MSMEIAEAPVQGPTTGKEPVITINVRPKSFSGALDGPRSGGDRTHISFVQKTDNGTHSTRIIG